MKNLLISAILALVTSIIFANDAAEKTKKRPTSAELRERIAARAKAEGGYVIKPVEGRVVRILSKTTALSNEDLSAASQEISKLLGIMCEVSGDENETSSRTGCLITLVEKDNYPTLLIAPEEPWAVLNVKNLRKDNPSDELLKTRIVKELIRAFGFAMGASNSSIQPCLMRPIFTLGDLDAEKVSTLSPDPLMGVSLTVDRLNFARPKRATYKRACQEGWAPAPTNDVQQAIWDKVKAEQAQVPTKPIKITPDMKPNGK